MSQQQEKYFGFVPPSQPTPEAQKNPSELVPMPITPPVQRVEVEGRVYEIVQVQPQAIAQQYQPPHYLQPQPMPRSSWMDDQNTVIFAGVALVVGTGCLTWLVMRAFTPVPMPAAQPQTVIVQPPQPEKKPFTREECRPAGLFGWGQDCYRERGYQ